MGSGPFSLRHLGRVGGFYTRTGSNPLQLTGYGGGKTIEHGTYLDEEADEIHLRKARHIPTQQSKTARTIARWNGHEIYSSKTAFRAETSAFSTQIEKATCRKKGEVLICPLKTRECGDSDKQHIPRQLGHERASPPSFDGPASAGRVRVYA